MQSGIGTWEQTVPINHLFCERFLILSINSSSPFALNVYRFWFAWCSNKTISIQTKGRWLMHIPFFFFSYFWGDKPTSEILATLLRFIRRRTGGVVGLNPKGGKRQMHKTCPCNSDLAYDTVASRCLCVLSGLVTLKCSLWGTFPKVLKLGFFSKLYLNN